MFALVSVVHYYYDFVSVFSALFFCLFLCSLCVCAAPRTCMNMFLFFLSLLLSSFSLCNCNFSLQFSSKFSRRTNFPVCVCVCVECQGFVALRSHISLFFFLQKCLSVLCIRSLSFIIIFHRFLVGLFVRLILFDTMLLVSFHSITFFFCVSPFFLSLLL